jgi:hypothetical protein
LVFASRPVARAESQTWSGLTTAIGKTGRRDLSHRWLPEQDAADAQLVQLLDQDCDAASIVGHAEPFVTRPQRRIELALDILMPMHNDFPPLSPNIEPTIARYGLINPATDRAQRFCPGVTTKCYPWS